MCARKTTCESGQGKEIAHRRTTKWSARGRHRDAVAHPQCFITPPDPFIAKKQNSVLSLIDGPFSPLHLSSQETEPAEQKTTRFVDTSSYTTAAFEAFAGFATPAHTERHAAKRAGHRTLDPSLSACLLELESSGTAQPPSLLHLLPSKFQEVRSLAHTFYLLL